MLKRYIAFTFLEYFVGGGGWRDVMREEIGKGEDGPVLSFDSVEEAESVALARCIDEEKSWNSRRDDNDKMFATYHVIDLQTGTAVAERVRDPEDSLMDAPSAVPA